MLPGRTDNAVKNRFHATERAKGRGKNDDDLYGVPIDEYFIDRLKVLHSGGDIDYKEISDLQQLIISSGSNKLLTRIDSSTSLCDTIGITTFF